MIKINFVVGSCLFWVCWRGSLWCWPCLRSPQWWRSGEGWAVLPGTYPLDYLRSQYITVHSGGGLAETGRYGQVNAPIRQITYSCLFGGGGSPEETGCYCEVYAPIRQIAYALCGGGRTEKTGQYCQVNAPIRYILLTLTIVVTVQR